MCHNIYSDTRFKENGTTCYVIIFITDYKKLALLKVLV